MNVSPTLRQRLDARREVRSPDECWPQTRGSVRIQWGTSKTQATELRRAVWLLEHGSFPGRYRHIEVLCGNSKCLNATPSSSPARPREEWHEDVGAVLWWRFPVVEPPYAGTPLDDDFPDYVTHWTPIAVPAAPSGPVGGDR